MGRRRVERPAPWRRRACSDAQRRLPRAPRRRPLASRQKEAWIPRKATGQVIVSEARRGRVYALRFRAYGRRRYLTLGTAHEGWTEGRARDELENVLADVRRGIWREPEPEPVVEDPRREPSFHEFASEWLAGRRHELSEQTVKNYRWALSVHLLPFFHRQSLG